MSQCEQTPGQTILGHGVSVHKFYEDLYWHLISGHSLALEWRLPEWITDPRITSRLTARLTAPCQLRPYHVYHDCGKPFVRTVDEEGRQHFPGHADASADLYLKAGGDSHIATLIRQDMDIHLLKADDCAAFIQRPHWADLLVTGLAEIHSNARMFGGIESTSFKIKWKALNQRGKKMLTLLE